MTDDAHDDGDRAEEHRRFAKELFNGTWDLIDKADRSADDDVAMFVSAAASRWHWGQVGGTKEVAISDWQVAHVASLLGFGDVALRFASRSLEAVTAEHFDGWQLAAAHGGMARAFAASGDAEGRARHVAAAEEALAHEADEEERELIASQLATVPEV
jgi:hypothetical protein